MSRCKFEDIIPHSGFLLSDIGNKIYHHVDDRMLNKEIKRKIIDIVDVYKNSFTKSQPNVYDVVGCVSDFDLIKTSYNCGGYFDFVNNQIAYNPKNIDNKKFLDRTIVHELGHFIQFSTIGLAWGNKHISSYLVEEQQAECIAFFLYKFMFGLEENFKKFDSYFNLFHIDYLNKHYRNQKVYDLSLIITPLLFFILLQY